MFQQNFRPRSPAKLVDGYTLTYINDEENKELKVYFQMLLKIGMLIASSLITVLVQKATSNIRICLFFN